MIGEHYSEKRPNIFLPLLIESVDVEGGKTMLIFKMSEAEPGEMAQSVRS